MTFTSDQLSNAFALANKYIEKQVPILFAMEHALLEKILANKQHASGTNLQFPIADSKMQNVGAITGTAADVINVNVQRNFTHGTLTWKYFYEGFSVDHQELSTATGPAAVVDIMTAKAENALESFKDWLHQQFYGSAASAPNNLNGLGDIFAASGTAYAELTDTDFGNDVAGDNLWLPIMDSTIHYIDYDNISPFIARIKAKRKSAIDYIYTTPAVYQTYKSNIQPGQRFMGSAEFKSGAADVYIDNVPIIPDAYVPGTGGGTDDSFMYGLTANTLGLKYVYGWDKPSPLDVKGVSLPNQPVLIRTSYYTANLYCNDRRLNFCLKTLDPTQAAS